MIHSNTDHTIAFLKKKWIDIIPGFSDSESWHISVFDDLMKRYSGKSRHYHNSFHIASMLHDWESNSPHFRDKSALGLAIFFHDAVYQAWKKDNEYQSSELARRFLSSLETKSNLQEKVCQLILATAMHLPVGDDPDMKWMLDMDLAILGQDRNTYREYIHAIRKEYRFVPSFVFKPARKRILQNFLQREELYFTEKYRFQYEKQARENILWEIHSH